MLYVPRALVLHQRPLTLLQYLGHQRRHIWFGSKLFYRREERFEVEDDGAAERQAAQGLPVHAQVDAGEGKIGHLQGAVVLVRIARGHEEGSIDLESPGPALDGLFGWKAGEESIERPQSARYLSGGDETGRTGPLRTPI